MGKPSAPVVGFWYSFGIHMGIGRGPVDELVEIRVGDRTAWWSGAETWAEPPPPELDDRGFYTGAFAGPVPSAPIGPVTGNTTINISANELFGGENSEGGIRGTFDVMMGGDDQEACPGLLKMLGGPLPGYRRMFTAFYNGRISAMNPYPKAWKFRVRRVVKGWENDTPWYPEKAAIKLTRPVVEGEVTSSADIIAMNPAHIIYECLTNREWGRGLRASRLNVASFVRCADALFDEQFGLCMKWSRRDSLENFVQSVLDHIGGVLYTDRSSALLTLKLIRGDYEAEQLPLFDANSGLLEITEAVVTALGPGVNEVVVSYTDPITNSTKSASVQNLASMQASGGAFNSLKKNYSGIPTPALALRVAQRDLKANALGIRRFRLVCDRRAWKVPPAGVLRIRDLSRGIDNIVVRVGRIEDGTLTNGKITITALQDVFGFPLSSFTGIEPPKWTGPSSKPDLKKHKVFEIPYATLSRNMRPADFAFLDPDVGFIGTVVEKPTPVSNGYNIAAKIGAPDPSEQPGN